MTPIHHHFEKLGWIETDIVKLFWVAGLVLAMAGIIFGVLYVRTSSLYTTIIIHAINNALAFALISFGVGDVTFSEVVGGGVTYYILYGVAAAIFVACSIEAYFRVFKTKKSID